MNVTVLPFAPALHMIKAAFAADCSLHDALDGTAPFGSGVAIMVIVGNREVSGLIDIPGLPIRRTLITNLRLRTRPQFARNLLQGKSSESSIRGIKSGTLIGLGYRSQTVRDGMRHG